MIRKFMLLFLLIISMFSIPLFAGPMKDVVYTALKDCDGHASPLGWTANGLLAYVSYFEDLEPRMRIRLDVQDMVTDKSRLTLSFSPGEEVSIEADRTRTDDIDLTDFPAYIATILERVNDATSIFDSFGFDFSQDAQKTGLEPVEYPEYGDFVYAADDSLCDGIHTITMYRYNYIEDFWESKNIGAVPFLVNEEIGSYRYFVSPFEKRIALVVCQPEIEGFYTETMMGCHMQVGFSPCEMDESDPQEWYWELMSRNPGYMF